MLAAAALAGAGVSAAQAQNLASFAVLAGSTITNTGSTVIGGNVGLSPGSAITGFPPGGVNAPYAIYQNDAVAAEAKNQLTTAYNILAGRPATADLTGTDLGGKTLSAGVYNFNNAAQLTGTLVLDGQGDPNAVFVFNVGSTLTTASASKVQLINGAQAGNVFFRVGSSATLGSSTQFQGKILALSSITLITGATVDCGAILARNGAVTLDTNVINICTVVVAATGTGTTTSAGQALADFTATGGLLPIGFAALSALTPAELAEALRELSGEAGTGTTPTTFENMDHFESLLTDHNGPGVVTVASQPAVPETVSVMGYQSTPVRAGGAFEGFDKPIVTSRALWKFWAAIYGDYTFTDATGSYAGRTSHNVGIVAGLDYSVSPDTTVGVAFGVATTGFDLADNLGGGRGTLAEIGIYGRKDFEKAYIEADLAYSYGNNTTDRTLAFTGDRFQGNFAAQDIAAGIEAGYHMGYFTPYAAVRGQVYYSPAYSETTAAGNSTYRLDYDASTALAARTELGTKLDWSRDLDAGMTLGLHAGAAWIHNFYPGTSIGASFPGLPGSHLTVNGAPAAADSALLSLGAELGFANNMTIAATVEGDFAPTMRSYAGSLKVSHTW